MEEIKEADLAGEEIGEAKISAKNKMLLLAIFAVLLGFVIKTEAAKRITVGFEDYKLQGIEKSYDINQLEESIKQKQAAQAKEANTNSNEGDSQSGNSSGRGDGNACPAGSGESCSQ